MYRIPSSRYPHTFLASYNRATLGIMGVVGNILILSVLLPVISTLMERKVEI
jgi:hypothetical protein